MIPPLGGILLKSSLFNLVSDVRLKSDSGLNSADSSWKHFSQCTAKFLLVAIWSPRCDPWYRCTATQFNAAGREGRADWFWGGKLLRGLVQDESVISPVAGRRAWLSDGLSTARLVSHPLISKNMSMTSFFFLFYFRMCAHLKLCMNVNVYDLQ